ncbi:alcohol dehydrogenase catalytic domain-containing protein [Halomonas garicola]|uniref:alcohol dehydrogenase catalytic domain-containing protein n=1 Tax=Halomonas garicola TaxID=1690008 RepID=UPI0028971937|nr:alcohol dehydrogenase catalytic domain-containing protein [Halomonas garicola]
MPTPTTMQAAFIRETGGVVHIEIGELPVPRPGPTDALVRMEASEVNHVDLFVRSGAFPTPTPFPFVIGRDLVGTVVEAGSGAAGFAVGDRVWCNSLGHDGRQGAFAEYAVVSAERLYPLPPKVAPLDAAAVLHGAATAHIGLVREAGLAAGDTLLATGGRAVVMAGLQGAAPALPVGAMYTREVSLHGFAISNASVSDLARAAGTINRLLAAGRLKGRIGATFSLTEAAEAHDAMAAGKVRGRVVVRSP